MMDEATCAYTAGIMDGESAILHFTTSTIRLGHMREKIPYILAELWGLGLVNSQGTWVVSGPDAVEIASSVRRYLLTERAMQQVDYVLN